MSLRAPVLALAFAAPLLAAGCSPSPTELARIGTRVITVDDFNVAARANWTQYPGNPVQARQMMLDDLVRRALLLSLAEARGMYRDTASANFRHGVEEEVLTQALNQELVPRAIPVSDAEVATFYEWSKIRSHLLLIYCPERAPAAAAAAELRAGKPFAAVEQRFTPAGLLPPGGDLGEVAAGSMVDPLDQFVREAPIGEIIGPVEATGEGWFVAKVLSRREVPPQAPFTVQKPLYSDLMRQRKQRLISVRAFQSLREQYRVTAEPGGAQAVFQLLNPASPQGGLAAPVTLSPEERARVVMRYVDAEGKPLAYTLGDAHDDLMIPDRPKPSPAEMGAINAWLEQQVIRRVVLIEARRRGLDREPRIARTLKERVNNSILESVYALEIQNAATASDDDVRAAYERHAGQLNTLVAARLLRVTLPDSAAAAALIQHGGHTPSLRDAAKMAGVTAPVGEERVTFPSRDPAWQAMKAELQTLTNGEWAGPLRAKDGWRVLQLIEKEERTSAYEELSPAIQHSLREEALTIKREERLGFVTDSLRRVIHPYQVHDDLLRTLAWPPAGAAMP